MAIKVILVGGGGHCKSCIDVIEQAGKFQIAGIVDLPEKIHQKVLGYEIIATDGDFPVLIKDFRYFLITLGQIKSPLKRIAIFNSLKALNARLPIIVSPHAYVSKHATIGEGTIVMHHACINADAVIGMNCIINSKTLIEHDAIVGDHCHIATGAKINGGAKIGQKSFVGSNSSIKQNTIIDDESIIQANIFV